MKLQKLIENCTQIDKSLEEGTSMIYEDNFEKALQSFLIAKEQMDVRTFIYELDNRGLKYHLIS